MSDLTPLTRGLSRVFTIEGRARPDHKPLFQSCMRGQAVSKAFGGVTDIECPDPHSPGHFVKVGQFQAGDERATITLEGRYAVDMRSYLLSLASKRCPFDVQLHFGACKDLSDFNAWGKILYLEDALAQTYDTEELGALQSEDNAAVNETLEVSARLIYDIVPMAFAAKAADLVTNEIVDVAVCDAASCGDCDVESAGCERAFAISLAAGGSPSTPPDILSTIDGGVTWYANDIDTLASTEDPNAVDCVSGYVVVVSEDARSHSYAAQSDFDVPTTDPAFTEVTGYAYGPRDLWSYGVGAFVVGVWGYIWKITDVTSAPTVLDAGTLTTSNYNRVHGLSDSFAVAVGDSGVIAYTDDGENWQLAPTSPVGVGVNLTAVAVKSENEWWVGTSAGRAYYTLNAGLTWTEKTFPGSGAGAVRDIVIATTSIMYISHSTAAPAGRILASFDGGYSWLVLPQSSALMPANDRFNRIAPCLADPGTLFAGGLGDNGADGILIVGTM